MPHERINSELSCTTLLFMEDNFTDLSRGLFVNDIIHIFLFLELSSHHNCIAASLAMKEHILILECKDSWKAVP